MCGLRGNTHTYPKTVDGPFHHKNVFLIIFLAIITKSNAAYDNPNVPCNYFDSINITNGIKRNDNTITFEGITYPEKFYAILDYEFTDEIHRQPVESHTRGCICKLKPCVSACCPRGQELFRNQCILNGSAFDMYANVYDGGESVEKNIFDHFNYMVSFPGRPSSNKRIVYLDPDRYPESDTWYLSKDGSILYGRNLSKTLDKNHYCFGAQLHNDSVKTILVTRFREAQASTKEYLVLCGMLLSVPFLLATIVVYISLPELRNVHGKSLVCYLCGLVVGNTSLALIKLNGDEHIRRELCQTVGYTTYISFMSAFLWLNVISYDLWRNFWGVQARRNFNDSKKFVCYSVYAWGLSIVATAFCFTLDATSFVTNSQFKPLIGIDTCFLSTSQYSQFLYFYLPIIVIMSSNCTFFVLTMWKIRKVQAEITKIIDRDESKIHRKNLESEREKWGLFLRLFVIMGVIWSMEAISFLGGPNSPYFYATDAINSTQGVVIFLMFVMRGKVKKLIARRWKKSRTSTTTTDTTTTPRSSALTAQSHNEFSEIEIALNEQKSD